MTIYAEFIEKVENGENFHIDFEQRNMKIGKKYLIKNGVWDTSRELEGIFYYEKPFGVIEVLYNAYKKSTPTERSDNQRRKYFKALSAEEMTDEQLVYGLNRNVAQARLEAYILLAILNGWKWQEEYGSWYWKSKNDPDLIILRSWVDGKEKTNEKQ